MLRSPKGGLWRCYSVQSGEGLPACGEFKTASNSCDCRRLSSIIKTPEGISRLHVCKRDGIYQHMTTPRGCPNFVFFFQFSSLVTRYTTKKIEFLKSAYTEMFQRPPISHCCTRFSQHLIEIKRYVRQPSTRVFILKASAVQFPRNVHQQNIQDSADAQH